jgi:hypothetical protein
MANIKITDLSSGVALIGTELFEAVQSTSSVKLTADQIKQFVLDNAYIQAISLVDQTAVVNTPTAIRLGTVDFSNDISIANDGGSQPTRITFANTGRYEVSINLQLDNSDSADHAIRVWQRKNGSDIASSGSIVSVPKAADGGTTIFELNTIFNATLAGDYLQYMFAVPNVAVTLRHDVAQTSPYAAPAVPSAIFIATQVN